MTYADRLRAARKREGLTQREVAARIGVSTTAFQYWEYASTRPTDEHTEAIRKLLGVKPPVPDTSEPEPVEVEASEPFRVDLPPHPSDQSVVEEAARCCIAVAKSQGSYHGTTADDLVTAHVGDDYRRWSKLIRRVRDRAEEKRPRLFACTAGAA